MDVDTESDEDLKGTCIWNNCILTLSIWKFLCFIFSDIHDHYRNDDVNTQYSSAREECDTTLLDSFQQSQNVISDGVFTSSWDVDVDNDNEDEASMPLQRKLCSRKLSLF